jgi:hypothetical protein
MPANHQSIKPIFVTPEINKSFGLGRAKARIDKEIVGCCTFEYKWLPRPAIRFTLTTVKAFDSNNLLRKSVLAIPPESTMEIPIVIQSTTKSDNGYEYRGFLSRTYIELSIPISSNECEKVIFHIPNYLGFGIRPIGLDWDRSEWNVTLYSNNDIDKLIKQLSENDGYAITQFGVLKRRDGKLFNMTQASTLLYSLRDLLSFVEGGWCVPLFPVGIRDGQIAWVILQAEMPSPWIGRHRLIQSVIDLGEMIVAFKNLVEIRTRDKERMLRLGNAIGMYIDACHARSEPTSLIMAQAALELLASLYADDHRIAMLEKYWTEKSKSKIDVPTSVLLKWLLENIGISTKLPESLKNLHEYQTKFKALKNKNGPEIITYMRNGLIHPTSKNVERAIGLDVNDLPAISEALALSKEYLGLVILHFLGYNGNYTSWVDYITKSVPWAEAMTF